MVFISAQPDDIYFIWQLELQLRNFHSFGISKKEIHIIIGHNPIVGLKSEFQQFIQDNKDLALFFPYPDTRKEPSYLSSIRPHLLEKHWKNNPELKDKTIFYHDSDVLFTRKMKIKNILNNTINYVSNTKHYLDSKYIISHSNKKTFQKMCKVIGISAKKIYKNDNNTGGAQYILKNIDEHFWKKVYDDSENIFKLLSDFNKEERQKTIIDTNYKPKEIQGWCSDMWSILWNLLYFKQKVQVHSELDFSWPTDNISYWKKKAIHHYAGEHENKNLFFYKRDYIHYSPWYDQKLYSIPNTNCSYPVVQLIKNRTKELSQKQSPLKNISFKFNKNNLEIKRYINSHFSFEENRCVIKRQIIELGNHKLIIQPQSIQKIDFLFETKKVNKIHFQNVFKIDQIFTDLFLKTLNHSILTINIKKFTKHNKLIVDIKNKNGNDILEIIDDVFLLL